MLGYYTQLCCDDQVSRAWQKLLFLVANTIQTHTLTSRLYYPLPHSMVTSNDHLYLILIFTGSLSLAAYEASRIYRLSRPNVKHENDSFVPLPPAPKEKP